MHRLICMQGRKARRWLPWRALCGRRLTHSRWVSKVPLPPIRHPCHRRAPGDSMSPIQVLPPVQRHGSDAVVYFRLLRGLAAAVRPDRPDDVPAASDRDPARWPTPVSPALDPTVESFVTDLMARMSLEQKVGQVIQARIALVTPDDIRRYHLGSVLNGGGSTPKATSGLRPRDWLAAADAFYDASMQCPPACRRYRSSGDRTPCTVTATCTAQRSSRTTSASVPR